MNILGSIAASMTGSSSSAATLLPELLEQLTRYPGGIAGLLDAFQKNGMGKLVASWLSNKEANLAVSADQLRTVFEPAMIDEMARTTGQDSNAVLASLTSLLPLVIDKLSPDGNLKDEVVDPGELTSMLAKMRGRFL